jgi:hypothetical protein
MKRQNYKYFIRKAHRYLGVFIGIQFLFWTLGGLFFSWTNINEIRGEHLRRETAEINFKQDFVSPKIIIEKIEKEPDFSAIQSLRLIEILGAPHYEFKVTNKNKKSKFMAADAVTGQIRVNISEDEAKKIAVESLAQPQNISQISYLTEENVGGHHEYREKPLPAWAVTFADNLTVYLSAETGQIGAFRTNSWRIFDFLWMLHTLDFQGRDDINNYLLRGFSLLGLTTILSGFMLFFTSSKFLRKLRLGNSTLKRKVVT